MGTATCEGAPGLTKGVMEGIYLTAGPGTPGDPTLGGSFPAEACLLCPATLNSTSGLQMEMGINGTPEVPNNLPSIHTTIHPLLNAVQHI